MNWKPNKWMAAGATAGLILIVGVGSASGDDRQLDYPKNKAGQSYGSDMRVTAPGQGPDLTLVVATNGVEGYVVSRDLQKATAPNFKSPDAALAWQSAKSGTSASIPVFEEDGVTRVGEFVIAYP